MLLPPETLLLDRYLIIRHLGYSGTMILYDAKDCVTGDVIILKHNPIIKVSPHQNFVNLKGKVKHFMRLSTKNSFTNAQGQFTILRDPLSDDLETLLQQQERPFAIEQVAEWAFQLLSTLEYLHSRTAPTIHRCICPSMLKLSSQNELVLLHSPMGKSLNEIRRNSKGKLNAYPSPEQLNGLNITYSSDLYSLGATLSYLLTGKEPATALVRMYALTHQHPDPLDLFHQLDLEIPSEVSDILMRSLSISPTKRPSSARAMRNAFNSVTPKPQSELTQTRRLDEPPLLLYQQPFAPTKRLWLKPLHIVLATVLFLLLAGVMNINSSFIVYGDTLPPTAIRLTIPTPTIIDPIPLIPDRSNRPLDTNRVYLKQ